MAKEKVKQLRGVLASVFAHHGHITRGRSAFHWGDQKDLDEQKPKERR